MSRAKVVSSILMVLILITLSGVSVWAAPNPQDEEPISGEIQNIAIEVDEDGTVTVVVTLVDDSGEIQTVSLSPEAAADLGLVQTENDEPVLDENGYPIPNNDMVGETVEIPGDVIEDGEEDGEEEDGEEDDEEPSAVHPVASALADFFNELLDLPEGAIMEHHESGIGFGVIAQACWMASELYDPEADDPITLEDILNAKTSGDFTFIPITLTDGTTTTAKNWGQFRKAVLGNEKAKKNLGAIMSGRANGAQEQEQEQEQEQVTTTSNKGQGKGKKDKGSDEEAVGSSTALPGKGKDKEGGKPDTPPGKEKDKGEGGGKDKGGGKGKGKP